MSAGSDPDVEDASGETDDVESSVSADDETVASAEGDSALFDVGESQDTSAADSAAGDVSDLDRAIAERDEYLDMARRVQAEFENYRRRVEGQRVEQIERAAEALVDDLLPVLDACEAAIAHGADDVAPVMSALFGTLEKRGLASLNQVDVPFDPTVHEAVLTEPGDSDDEASVVAVMRTGYTWNGRVLRPAMVKVRG